MRDRRGSARHALDRRDIAAGLRAQTPDLVVDASGPFQDYGAGRYAVIEACIAAGIDYLDFADAADFVFGVPQFDAAAKAAGIFVLSGVSSFPVLTAAVLREMARTMDIVGVEGGIAPSPYAGIGLNVMRAVVGYAGAPVKLLRDGRPSQGFGLAESMRFTVAVPGRLPLRNIHFSLVDVPDLQVIPPEHPTMTDIWMGAGPVPEILHRILNLLAKARARLPPALARALYPRSSTPSSTGCGSATIAVACSSAPMASPTAKVRQSWHLLAEGDDGPYIPSMAIEAVIRKLLDGARDRRPVRVRASARSNSATMKHCSATGRSSWAFAPMMTAVRLCIGGYWDQPSTRFPRDCRNCTDDRRHGAGQATQRCGAVTVSRPGSSARCWVSPKRRRRAQVAVAFTPEGDGERWTRNFDGRVFSSVQSYGTGRDHYLLVERFGIASFALALVVEGDRLFLIPRRWSLLGISMPHFLLPRGASFETEQDGTFCFDVEIAAPFIGLIAAYQGRLDPEPSSRVLERNRHGRPQPDRAALPDIALPLRVSDRSPCTLA
jgi:hypothetical protein